MRLVIVDDEPKIMRGLKGLVPKLDPKWEVVGTAENGMEAMSIIKEFKPDVVLLDIQMPGMNAFDLMDRLVEINPTVLIIIISGFAYFEYAQKSVSYGVLDYILKPVNPEKLREALKNADNIITKRNQDSEDSSYFQKSLHELREKLIYDLIFEAVEPDSEQTKKKLSQLKLSDHPYLVVTLSAMNSKGVRNELYKSEFERILNRHLGGYVLCNGNASFILVIFLGGEQEVVDSNAFLVLQEITLQFCNSGFNTGIGNIKHSILEISDSYKESLDMIRQKSIKTAAKAFSGASQQSMLNKGLSMDFTYEEVLKNSARYSPYVSVVLRYIENNYTQPLKIENIASMVHFHSNYLSGFFKKETNVNLSNFIMEYKIHMAKQFLSDYNNKIYMVAEKIGFKDQRYFSQVFKKYTGMTPAEFREHAITG